MFEGAGTRVRILFRETDDFSIRVGIHKDLALSPYKGYIIGWGTVVHAVCRW